MKANDNNSKTSSPDLDQNSVFVFDADDTIFVLSEPIHITYSRFLSLFGISCSPDSLALHTPVVWVALRRQYLAQDNIRTVNPETEKEFWQLFANRLVEASCGSTMPSECFQALYAFYQTAASRALRPQAIETFQYFRDKRVPLYVVTNNDVRIHLLLQDMNIDHYFKGVVSASELGVKKPSYKFFHEVEKYFNLESAKIFYLGNDLEIDALPSLAYGWKAIWLRDGDPLRESTAIPSIPSFSALLDLFADH